MFKCILVVRVELEFQFRKVNIYQVNRQRNSMYEFHFLNLNGNSIKHTIVN
jgi:hypothetical protein